MFASKTPRDLNHDPKPWVHDHHCECSDNGTRLRFNNGIGNVFDPRPEYDHVQHNEPNPILVEFRQALVEDAALNRDDTVEDYLILCDPLFWGDAEADLAQIDHARRVLTRLGRIRKVVA